MRHRLWAVQDGWDIYGLALPFLTPHSLLAAFEDGTDTWFRNVGILHIDAGEIPKITYTIFKSRRKLEIYNEYISFHKLPQSIDKSVFRQIGYISQRHFSNAIRRPYEGIPVISICQSSPHKRDFSKIIMYYVILFNP